MLYQKNDKHKEPWRRGRRGSLCPREIGPGMAQALLSDSLSDSKAEGGKRYAVRDGRAYCAQRHDAVRNAWHGYPVGWKEVPENLRRRWLKANLLRKKDMKDHWDG